ncbi:hypothetical protein SESBI_48760 [Sesbania bispinosa]|nr:hypothetical protein SESBI_48760 [Sesbania bispinosa]
MEPKDARGTMILSTNDGVGENSAALIRCKNTLKRRYTEKVEIRRTTGGSPNGKRAKMSQHERRG